MELREKLIRFERRLCAELGVSPCVPVVSLGAAGIGRIADTIFNEAARRFMTQIVLQGPLLYFPS